MRVLVTGISGFAGPVVARALAERGHTVHGFVRHAPDERRMVGVSLPLHTGDVCDGTRLAQVLREAAPDAVLHLAAVAEPAAAEADPAAAYRVNLGGTLAVLEAARGATPRP